MTFLQPWGLLALLAVPVILGLHFFRQQRRQQQIGGLHLWDFARIATPAGRRFERLHSSLPLLFQLLAAILLALLLAGLDLPLQHSAHQYTIVLDDSVSMKATAAGQTSAQRAIDQLTDWAPSGDKFTLVLAGAQPQVIAGPAASRSDFLRTLAQWKPGSDTAHFDQAINIAQKFGTGNSRMIVVTDNPDQVPRGHSPTQKNADGESAEPAEESATAGPGITVWGVGHAALNRGITFADRFRPSSSEERIVATVQRFGGAAEQATLQVFQGDNPVLSQAVDLPTTAPVTVQLDFPATDAPLRLQLSPEDALAADNSALLRPATVRPVNAYVDPALPEADAFEKAIQAVPQAFLTREQEQADIAFMNGTTAPLDLAAARRVYRFEAGAVTSASLRVAQGRDLLMANDSPLTENLFMEGVIWPSSRALEPDPRLALRADISYTSVPLLYRQGTQRGTEIYRANIALSQSNIVHHTAWPVLIMNMIEDCRAALPGVARSNLRSGEALRLNFGDDTNTTGTGVNPAGEPPVFALFDADASEPVQTWENHAPEFLTGLESGNWAIRGGASADAPLLAEFTVNLFSPPESDLQPMRPLKPKAEELTAEISPRTQQNFLVYYALLAGLIGCILLAWVYHDSGH